MKYNFKEWWLGFKIMCEMYDVFCAMTILTLYVSLMALGVYFYVS